jgi:hypothetical protein
MIFQNESLPDSQSLQLSVAQTETLALRKTLRFLVPRQAAFQSDAE